MILWLVCMWGAEAATYEGGIIRHRQNWIASEGKWTHDHVNECSGVELPDLDNGQLLGNYWYSNPSSPASGEPESPWTYSEQQGYYSGSGRDAFFLSYTLCGFDDVTEANAVRDAFGAYFTSVGFMFLEDTSVGCGVIATLPEEDWVSNEIVPELAQSESAVLVANKLQDNEVVLDPGHQIRLVTSSFDGAYYYVARESSVSSEVSTVPARTYNAHKQLLNGPTGHVPTGPNATWEIFVNAVDYDWYSGLPSSYVFAEPSDGRHLRQIVAHEILHVLGMGHRPQIEYVYEPSSINIHDRDEYSYVHPGLEVDARIYEPTANTFLMEGEYVVPVVDRDFLRDGDHYGTSGSLPDRIRLHAWRWQNPASPLVLKMGSQASDSSTLVDFPVFEVNQDFGEEGCPNRITDWSSTNLDAVVNALPSFTADGAHTLTVEFAAQPISYEPNLAFLMDIDGEATIQVPADGEYSSQAQLPSLSFAELDIWDGSGSEQSLGHVEYQLLADVYEGSSLLYYRVPLNVVFTGMDCGEEE